MEDNTSLNQENTLGQDQLVEIPREVKRFNWGAFFFTWIWGLANNSYLTLLSLALFVISFIIPFIIGIGAGLSGNKEVYAASLGFSFIFNIIVILAWWGLRIWFGIKGDDWAWKNKHWKSTEHFNNVQRTWAIAGLIWWGLIIIFFIGIIAAIVLPTLLNDTSAIKSKTMMKKSMVILTQATVMNEALEKECQMTSGGLAKCFSERINGTLSGNKIMGNGINADFIFYGDGKCNSKNTCYVTFDTTNAGGNDSYTLHLYSDKGYVKINQTDQDEFMKKYTTKK